MFFGLSSSEWARFPVGICAWQDGLPRMDRRLAGRRSGKAGAFGPSGPSDSYRLKLLEAIGERRKWHGKDHQRKTFPRCPIHLKRGQLVLLAGVDGTARSLGAIGEVAGVVLAGAVIGEVGVVLAGAVLIGEALIGVGAEKAAGAGGLVDGAAGVGGTDGVGTLGAHLAAGEAMAGGAGAALAAVGVAPTGPLGALRSPGMVLAGASLAGTILAGSAAGGLTNRRNGHSQSGRPSQQSQWRPASLQSPLRKTAKVCKRDGAKHLPRGTWSQKIGGNPPKMPKMPRKNRRR